jgi:hypothetical protein
MLPGRAFGKERLLDFSANKSPGLPRTRAIPGRCRLQEGRRPLWHRTPCPPRIEPGLLLLTPRGL